MHLLKNSSTNYEIREEILEGRKHIIVPVTMMVEGVHHGSQGPLFYPLSELRTFTEAWNGRPVIINHPEDAEGNPISANSPEVTNKEIIGKIFNSHIEGNALKAEAWIDYDKLLSISESTLNKILQKNAIEVSVGVYTEEENIQGDWNDEHYEAIARNYRPDHLAILPESIGACSFDDGCGIRNNKLVINYENSTLPKEVITRKQSTLELVKNQTDYKELVPNVQRMLDSMDSEMSIHFLEALYEDSFIYRKVNRQTNQEKLYKQNYSTQETEIALEGEPEEVRKNTEYTTVNGQMKINFNNKETGMENNKVPCKIDKLISNENTKFEEKDREWLEKLEDSALDKLIPVEPKAEPKEPEVNIQDEIKSYLSGLSDEEKMKLLSTEAQAALNEAKKIREEKRAKLIKGITDNSDFTEEELKEEPTEKLEKLSKTITPKMDYSVHSGGVTSNVDEIDEEFKATLTYLNGQENGEHSKN